MTVNEPSILEVVSETWPNTPETMDTTTPQVIAFVIMSQQEKSVKRAGTVKNFNLFNNFFFQI